MLAQRIRDLEDESRIVARLVEAWMCDELGTTWMGSSLEA
jgi:hypothetical protein